MKFLLAMLLYGQAFAAIELVSDQVKPFSNPSYPLKVLVKDYAEMMKINVTYPSNLFRDKETVHIELNSPVSKEEFKKLVYNLLNTQGYTPIEENKIVWIASSRDIRYIPTKVYTDQSFPKDASYSTVLIRLKYPLSSEIARNMRPFMSRYGRVIDLSDAKTLIINDRGDNVDRLIQTIKSLDIEVAYKNLLDFKPKPQDEDEGNPLKEKVVELELEKKILEKKLVELKGQQTGGHP